MSLFDNLRKILGVAVSAHAADLYAVQELLGYHFRDTALLLLSLTHRSYSRFDQDHSPSNERLEFLGDSVLGLVIADQLFQDNPDLREGELTQTKAKLVNENALASVAGDIGLNKFLRLSPEEDKAGGRSRPSIISDAFESVIAAVYLDGGLEAARDVILRLIYSRRDELATDSAQRNFKGELLELTQSRGDGAPRYDVLAAEGPDHRKRFNIAVNVAGQRVGSGEGSSKKEAEQQAAAVALKKLSEDAP
ncbi:MAG: ribonuclease III [candidate division Zixibacteria bacterium]|nr:ribonuclease III [candidate division Zixibacteria bacterium]MDH3938486.1 ribonuclease III [candidate division Zixibacteria bacterium]MDH4033561.1 ribonuclease III [candidate division Zixibacteria bacterium]